jgi:LysR family transcriptional regulator, positive regulator for ilvC
MSPSALTRRIQGLEQELGRALFLRDQRSVELTREGELFRDYVRGELARWSDIKAAIQLDETSPRGDLRIACTVTACHSVLPALLAACRKKYPQVRVRLMTQDASRSLEELERGDVDIAVVPTEDRDDSGLAIQVLGRTDLVFVGPLEDDQSGSEFPIEAPPRNPAELARIPVVMPLSGIERERMEAFFASRGAVPRIVAEVRGNEGVLAMVSLGSGISLVPRLVLEKSPLLSQVRPLFKWPSPAGYNVSLCAKPKTLSRSVARAFWDLSQGDPKSP